MRVSCRRNCSVALARSSCCLSACRCLASSSTRSFLDSLSFFSCFAADEASCSCRRLFSIFRFSMNLAVAATGEDEIGQNERGKDELN
jgi:hypothetical protein